MRENGSISIGDIMNHFDVSEATARRDLETLEQERKLIRTFGGAVLETVRTEIPFYRKMEMNTEEKKEIAEKALSVIRDGDVVGLTGGSTNMMIARRIQQKPFERLTVVTNAVNVAFELSGKPGLQLIVTGGVIRTQSYELSGPFAEATLGQLTIQKAFIGADGVSIARGVTTFDELEAHTNRVMMRRAIETYVVADHTKLNRDSIFRIEDLSSVTAVLTDSRVDPDIRASYAEAGIRLL
ncbi:DeoR/GlpR transcriptional regulator [Paenibacillus thermoaerophilus]|nr:DeoR/GlpR transcriptional regulator [Paenibacillus thermoaerophilus]